MLRRCAALVTFLLIAALVPTALIAPTPAVAAGAGVVINELYYNPVDGNQANEFVELLNASDTAVDIGGWYFSGITFTFPAGFVVAPGAFVVLRPGLYSGALSNSGERIRLRDASGKTIDEVEYDDNGEWPSMADGEGSSLERRVPGVSANKPGNWVSGGPTPGAPNSNLGGVLPSFSGVTHTVLPAPGQPIEVTAKVTDAVSAALVYRVGFGVEVPVPVTLSGTTLTATIPGQASGQLVRYRITATSAEGVIGAWPRQGDGAGYTGTTVAAPSASPLPTLQWFMEDAVYNAAFKDLTLSGDDGYPAVFAYAGTIFDNSKIRVKGQVSRTQPKKKWKVIFAKGYALDIPGVLPEPVDEFALHSSYSDKSFIRETLASEMLTAAGIPVSQSFPMRIERNGAFYGLYSYVEQQDGTWRDRAGYDDSIVYEVGGGKQFALLDASDANLGQTQLRNKYEKETQEWLGDDELRTLIRTLNGLSGQARRDWIYANVDVASVVNLIAGVVVIQHQDLGHKNYRLIFNEHQRWEVVPTDFDLVLGRRWSVDTGAVSDVVGIQGAFEHPGGPLFGAFWFD
ncbi:MAG TPA: CotH kinase family protein, partial [Ilumatobacteraceae bacterium]|nr:CotH kinase family protein [Ilumatobacteraceae bacterium]